MHFAGGALATCRGGCHCGCVRFECEVQPRPVALVCDCPICRMTGFQHSITPASRFQLLSGEAALRDYQFGTGEARHLFCGHWVIKSFDVPCSHPDGIDIDVRWLEEGCVAGFEWRAFSDVDREAETAAWAHLDLVFPGSARRV